MNSRLQVPKACVLALILCLVVVLLPSCESDSAAYHRGVADGQAQAAATADIAREEGRQAGFKEGYEAARPTASTTAPTGARHALSVVVMLLGMAKIILSLLVFVLLLVLDSSSVAERLAKMIATSLAMVVVFWLSNSFTVGFSQPLTNALLDPAASTTAGKLVTGLIAAVVTWAGCWTLEIVAELSEDNQYVQTAFVFVASAIMSILVPLFVSLQSVPNINGYRFFDLMVGVAVGGMLWLVHRLLVQATNSAARKRRSLR